MAELLIVMPLYTELLNHKLDDFCQDGMCFELEEDEYFRHVDIMSEAALRLANEVGNYYATMEVRLR